MKQKIPKRPFKCPYHDDELILHRNTRTGGYFWACIYDECSITFSLEGDQISGDPACFGKASKNRSTCVSVRQRFIARLIAKHGYAPKEAMEFMNREGITGVQKLFDT